MDSRCLVMYGSNTTRSNSSHTDRGLFTCAIVLGLNIKSKKVWIFFFCFGQRVTFDVFLQEPPHEKHFFIWKLFLYTYTTL